MNANVAKVAAGVCAALSMVTSAHALTWTLMDVSFSDNTLISGSFDYDAATDVYSNWNISVLASGVLPAYTYQDGPGGGFLGVHSALAADFVAFPPDAPSGRYIRLGFSGPLTDAGGTVTIDASNAFECDNCSSLRTIVGGLVVAQAVPEPGQWALFGLGLGMLGVAVRRRRTG